MQNKTLDALEAIMDDDAGFKFLKANLTTQATLGAFVSMTSDADLEKAKRLLERLN